MLDLLPYIISGAALVLALLAVLGFERAALTAVLVALGSGQIHMAVAALGLFLLAANRNHYSSPLTFGGYAWGGVLLGGILLTTAFAPSSSRTLIELAQLALYVIILLLVMSYLGTGERLLAFLQSSVLAAFIVASMAMILVVLEQASPPSIFMGRGSNEGAVFLSLLGVLPASVMFVRTRNPAYLLSALFFIYLQNVATSRGSVAVAGSVVVLSLFFIFHNRFIRAILVLSGLYILVTNVPMLDVLYKSQLNFSARERMALLIYGIWLWRQNPIMGWGWGSTTDLAQRAPTTELYYPHFHNTYVQLLVESGVVGILILGTFFYVGVGRVVIAATTIRQPSVTMLTSAVLVALSVSGLFDAMLYGADRAVQVVILIALSVQSVALAQKSAPDLSPKRSGNELSASPAAR